MTKEEKAYQIILAIRDFVNSDETLEYNSITFFADWDGNSLTVSMTDNGVSGHSHVGDTNFTEEQMINDLYQLLCHGRGLGFV